MTWVASEKNFYFEENIKNVYQLKNYQYLFLVEVVKDNYSLFYVINDTLKIELVKTTSTPAYVLSGKSKICLVYVNGFLSSKKYILEIYNLSSFNMIQKDTFTLEYDIQPIGFDDFNFYYKTSFLGFQDLFKYSLENKTIQHSRFSCSGIYELSHDQQYSFCLDILKSNLTLYKNDTKILETNDVSLARFLTDDYILFYTGENPFLYNYITDKLESLSFTPLEYDTKLNIFYEKSDDKIIVRRDVGNKEEIISISLDDNMKGTRLSQHCLCICYSNYLNVVQCLDYQKEIWHIQDELINLSFLKSKSQEDHFRIAELTLKLENLNMIYDMNNKNLN
jgi:hypothetical protein